MPSNDSTTAASNNFATEAATASLRALQRELADSIIRRAPLDEIRILLACGAKVNEPVTQGTKVYFTSLLFYLPILFYLFLGLRPLHYATYQKYEKAVNLLLVRGCDVNAMDEVGYTALHLCAERGYGDLMQLLIEHNARVRYTQLKPEDKVSRKNHDRVRQRKDRINYFIFFRFYL